MGRTTQRRTASRRYLFLYHRPEHAGARGISERPRYDIALTGLSGPHLQSATTLGFFGDLLSKRIDPCSDLKSMLRGHLRHGRHVRLILRPVFRLRTMNELHDFLIRVISFRDLEKARTDLLVVCGVTCGAGIIDKKALDVKKTGR